MADGKAREHAWRAWRCGTAVQYRRAGVAGYRRLRPAAPGSVPPPERIAADAGPRNALRLRGSGFSRAPNRLRCTRAFVASAALCGRVPGVQLPRHPASLGGETVLLRKTGRSKEGW